MLVNRIYSWLSQRPILNLVLVISYYFAVVLPHNSFGAWIAKNLDEPFGRDQYNLIVLSCGLISLLGYLFVFWKGLNNASHKVNSLSNHKKKIWLYLLLTVFLIVLSFNTILVVNVEIIHLVQYAILSILLFPLFQHYSVTLFCIIILGGLDELYQYQILSPTYNYYDFNDVILDTLGGALGLILTRAQGFIIDEKVSQRAATKIWWIGIGLLIFIIGGFSSGYFVVYPLESGEEAVFQLIRKYDPSFWRTVHPKVTYHVVQPLEGILLITILFWIYSYLNIKKEKNQVFLGLKNLVLKSLF